MYFATLVMAARQSVLWVCGDYMQVPVCWVLFTLADTHCNSLGWKYFLTLCCWRWSPWLHEAAGASLQVWSGQSWFCELLYSEILHVASTQCLRVAHVIRIWTRCVLICHLHQIRLVLCKSMFKVALLSCHTLNSGAARTDSIACQLFKRQCGDGEIHLWTLQSQSGSQEQGVLNNCMWTYVIKHDWGQSDNWYNV